MTVDLTRIPVVAGAAQFTNREEDPSVAPDPFAMMERVGRQAAAGFGAGRLTHCWMVHSLSLRHGDPAAELARRLGATSAEARCSGMGGSVPQWLVNRAAELVAAGRRPLVLVAGAEALATRRRAKRAGVTLTWPSAPGWPDTWPPLEPDLGVHRVERAAGLHEATTMYALIETALAHAAGHDPAAHRAAMGRLMDRFNAVAADNPYSWFPARRRAEELVTAGPDNRMVNFPYPKYLNAVMDVDMAAAVVVTDAQTARDAGLGPDEVAHLAGWADATDIWYLCERPEVHRAPALEACAAATFALAGLGPDDVDAFDLYACFPSSIEVGRQALGIGDGDPRPLTVTGGLPYHGGPGSNYVTHAVANALERVRAGAGAVAVHGNGYYLTKHSLGLYTAAVPERAPAPPEGLQARLDEAARPVPAADGAEGPATVVAYTVPYGRDGEPQDPIVLLDTPGGRTVARGEPGLRARLEETDAVGSPVTVAVTDGRPVAG